MKRYTPTYKANRKRGHGFLKTTYEGDMQEDPNGGWRKGEDVEKIEELNREMVRITREWVEMRVDTKLVSDARKVLAKAEGEGDISGSGSI